MIPVRLDGTFYTLHTFFDSAIRQSNNRKVPSVHNIHFYGNGDRLYTVNRTAKCLHEHRDTNMHLQRMDVQVEIIKGWQLFSPRKTTKNRKRKRKRKRERGTSSM